MSNICSGLGEYLAYHHEDRTHIGLEKTTPASRPAEPRLTRTAEVLALPQTWRSLSSLRLVSRGVIGAEDVRIKHPVAFRSSDGPLFISVRSGRIARCRPACIAAT